MELYKKLHSHFEGKAPDYPEFNEWIICMCVQEPKKHPLIDLLAGHWLLMKKPLELKMFIAVDKEGKPISQETIDSYNLGHNLGCARQDKFRSELEKAQEKILFEGFECEEKNDGEPYFIIHAPQNLTFINTQEYDDVAESGKTISNMVEKPVTEQYFKLITGE